MKRVFKLRNRGVLSHLIEFLHELPLSEDDPMCVEVKPMTRTLDQNAKLWPMLDDVSKQVVWYGQKLKSEEWKHIFTASLKGQKAVPGIDGGFVVLGQSTSVMSKRTFSELIELIYAFGADHDVIWSEPVPER